ncbi:hypothetical protein STRCR_0386 [Streptococcus criceti HS-6]|uniref:Uncharacterized protein n=1 Tax=Streptococcus criceti HS-6 TaxID=873449 RepID=G5JPN3_STRCG|nr:hypothetical protein STRCR_0386 [Streptococcus criceti HS-6]
MVITVVSNFRFGLVAKGKPASTGLLVLGKSIPVFYFLQ